MIKGYLRDRYITISFLVFLVLFEMKEKYIREKKDEEGRRNVDGRGVENVL